uniref:Uncharacterized protein n=1 Tax=Oryza punctata TaxID=4537 RepID=A0A0E0KRT4_ORYPU
MSRLLVAARRPPWHIIVVDHLGLHCPLSSAASAQRPSSPTASTLRLIIVDQNVIAPLRRHGPSSSCRDALRRGGNSPGWGNWLHRLQVADYSGCTGRSERRLLQSTPRAAAGHPQRKDGSLPRHFHASGVVIRPKQMLRGQK